MLDFIEHIVSLFKLFINLKMGIATVFLPEFDLYNPNPYLPCFHRDMRWSDRVVAHKTLPCKSKVFLYNPRTNRSTWAVVGDWGPRKSLVDLSPAIAKELKHNGKELVFLLPINKK